MNDPGANSPPPSGPGSGMDPIPGSGMAGDPLQGSPADPARPDFPQNNLFWPPSRRRRSATPANGGLRVALFLVGLAVFVAIAIFVIVQISSNSQPKLPPQPGFPALNNPNAGFPQTGGGAASP